MAYTRIVRVELTCIPTDDGETQWRIADEKGEHIELTPDRWLPYLGMNLRTVMGANGTVFFTATWSQDEAWQLKRRLPQRYHWENYDVR